VLTSTLVVLAVRALRRGWFRKAVEDAWSWPRRPALRPGRL